LHTVNSVYNLRYEQNKQNCFMLKIHTFGGLNIKRDDTPVAGLVSRKVEALLVYLACNPHEHSREALADLFWGDMMPDRSLANLRVAISNLQQSLAP
jgi:DNA-binding SARP family transcriptional activator